MLKQNQIMSRGKSYIHENRLQKAKIIANIVQKHYEPGRQDRSLEWIYRNIVNKQYPMCLATFMRYIHIARKHLGYDFDFQNRSKQYIFDIYDRMQPDTIEKVKYICGEAGRSEYDRQTDVYEEMEERLGLDISLNQFLMYLRVGVYCMGYEVRCLKKS